MKLPSIIFGVAITVILLAMLVATRMMDLTPASTTEYEIREIDTVELPEPPPPDSEELPVEDEPPPPPPALADLSVTFDVNQPAISVSPIKVDPKLSVETFFSDHPPAPIPRASVKRVTPPSTGRPGPRSPSRPQIKRPSVQKSEYSIGELDQKPRLLRNPSVSFPRSIRNAKSGRVVVRVTILPSGRSRFLSLVSTTHPALVAPARRIANGSRFTPPTRHGKAVKATMTWPIYIKK